jgi:hypothetical protein
MFHQALEQGLISTDILVKTPSATRWNPNICFAFDLSIDKHQLDQIIFAFGSPQFQAKFFSFRFSSIFLSTVPIFVTKQKGIVNVSFTQIFDPRGQRDFDAAELASLLDEIHREVRLLVPDFAGQTDYSRLFDGIREWPIQSLVVFHSQRNPPTPAELPFAVHLIEILSGFEKPDSIFLPFRQGWSHCHLFQPRTELIEYLEHAVDVKSKRLKFSVAFSSGFEIQWVSGAKNERQLNSDRAEFEFTNYPADLSIFVACGAPPSFSRVSHVSAQVVAQFSGDYCIVINRCWRKANSLGEWLDSFNNVTVSSMIMKQMAAHFLLGKSRVFPNEYTWNLQSLPRNHPTVSVVREIIALFEVLCVSDRSDLPQTVRFDVLFAAMTRGPNYLGSLARALSGLRGSTDSFVIPPFLGVRDGKVDEVAFDDRIQCGLIPIRIVLSQAVFEKVQRAIEATSSSEIPSRL